MDNAFHGKSQQAGWLNAITSKDGEYDQSRIHSRTPTTWRSAKGEPMEGIENVETCEVGNLMGKRQEPGVARRPDVRGREGGHPLPQPTRKGEKMNDLAELAVNKLVDSLDEGAIRSILVESILAGEVIAYTMVLGKPPIPKEKKTRKPRTPKNVPVTNEPEF